MRARVPVRDTVQDVVSIPALWLAKLGKSELDRTTKQYHLTHKEMNMKNRRFEITSEQTLRLSELRDVLDRALEGEANVVEFPTAHFPIEPRSCTNCATSCSTTCIGLCKGSCTGGCKGCTGSCSGSCTGSAQLTCSICGGGNCVQSCANGCGYNCLGTCYVVGGQ